MIKRLIEKLRSYSPTSGYSKVMLEAADELEAASYLLYSAADQLEKAAEYVESWGCYASPYFQEKHDLEGDVNKFKACAELIRAEIVEIAEDK